MTSTPSSPLPSGLGGAPPHPEQAPRGGRAVLDWAGRHSTGVVAIALGVAGVLEARRIRETVRPTSPSFGVVGPDGYLFVVAGALLIGGILYLAAGLVQSRLSGGVETVLPAASAGSAWRRVILLGALLAVYVYGITTLGYALSTLVFVVLAARVSGLKSWWKAAVFALTVTALSYGLFVYEAGLPLPAGPFGLG